ncbi:MULTISPECIES: SDR family NAD(P)-dependent oxidoreductase [Vibrio]|uniref:SDR family NAD(P)-dependent oxidoreductase n=1 Tax=bacterium 19MO03SA05 TaxID=2920620 RepID=A0AAU6VGJ5_UNCXX|nr:MULTISPECIES: SDR family NAD(P)-dependent oxidoreductase [Vibrio]EKO3583046.1 SDR family NAD(P)-dependent oxidoreductase [Vibrio metschnikovii]EKO3637781.1 SDR family NAD(P)-dependent oxidoreductase [Vibrio metschnikovii]EKO3656159.1 SDR family NAD(P)-dependent oxidoreductase [Vibrio metschnikovii]EKO3657129.1 SDR family NAD(P)-dependent oxidoreductase [Vibrio metschnikovii]EKO3671432.1 SDR family NAD(P)-dependent oxidoreductase [Vibrio metschnikovii]
MNGVLITGASSGIGLQLAKDYAQQGWSVIACGRNLTALQTLQAEYPTIEILIADVTDRHATLNALSSLTVVPTLWILNAGSCEYIDDGVMDSALLGRVFEVNVLGIAHCIEGIQPYLTQGHRVAFVGSIASELPLPRAEAYGASKAAVNYLARTLRLDWQAKEVEVTTIFPGFVTTPLTDKNTFPMPMIITVEQASLAIRQGLAKGKQSIYFPAVFTWIIRLIAALPYRWQHAIVKRLVGA